MLAHSRNGTNNAHFPHTTQAQLEVLFKVHKLNNNENFIKTSQLNTYKIKKLKEHLS